MDLILHRPHDRRSVQRYPPPWPAIFAWTLCGIAVVHAWLLPSITDPRSPQAIAIQLLQPSAALGAIGLMLVAAWRHGSGLRRWAWSLHAGAILASVAGVLVQIAARVDRTPVVTPLSDALYILTYLLALIGTALYLPLRSWWVGSTIRILLDSTAVSIATLVILHSVLPRLIQPWTASFSAQLNWLALDVGVLFCTGLLGLRYARSGGPLVALIFPSFLCLLLGDIIFLVVSRWPNGELWHFVPGPLYTLFRVLLALGAYRGVAQPPQAPSEPFKVMPMAEWLIWTTIPRVLALVAMSVASGRILPPRAALIALLIVTGAREALAAYEQRRVTLALHAAQHEATAAATHMQEFLTRIVHDIAAPLHGLRTIADQGQSDMRDRSAAGPLQTQLAHLERMIDQLRTYLQSRTVPLVIAVVDVAPICAAAMRAAQARAADAGVQLRLAFETNALTVWGDAGAIRRILDNLLVNALAATPAGAEVVLRVHAEDHASITLTVRDPGSGIPAHQQARIFEPLVRLRSGPGFGLGLAIVHELTRAMGGQVGVSSDGTAGSAFWVRLRRLNSESPEDVHADHLSD